jgi:transketolase
MTTERVEKHLLLEQKIVNTIRTLSIDMVEKANSGHPGMPMGAAPMAYTLWGKHLKFNSKNPDWFNRDRFVLSAGHGSALYYSLLHLFGYDVTIEDLKNFRQWGSQTPGHPEYGETVGVDATTGPLGQGVAMGVGMALAESHLAAQYNRPNFDIVDHYTYVICGDGDLMEGVSSEASSFAGHNALGKLIMLYDSNDISLDGDLDRSFSEDVAMRYEAYGWHVLRVEDGNDLQEINQALEEAKKIKDRPTLIEVKTIIGYGSPNKAGSSASHGAPLGPDEVSASKEAYGWTEDPFFVSEEVREELDHVIRKGEHLEAVWQELLEAYTEEFPELADQFMRVLEGDIVEPIKECLPNFEDRIEESIATRSASGEIINTLSQKLPELFGGSADLGGSNKTFIDSDGAYSRDTPEERNIWFGVREFALGGMMNGMALHGGLKVFGSTFFVFSDYMRAAMRLSALMQLPVTYVFSHDSVAVGEDGPTHEPIEHLASLRAMPGLTILRPADAKETVAAWEIAISNNEGPIVLVLSRQNLPVLENKQKRVNEGVKRGAYIVKESSKEKVDVLLLATGSEVSLALDVQKYLERKFKIGANVISIPSWELFAKQNQEYKEIVLPKENIVRVSIEAGSTFGWRELIGDKGLSIGIDHFGVSAPGERIFKEFGFTAEAIAEKVKYHLEGVNKND